MPTLHELQKQIEELEAQAQKVQDPVPSAPVETAPADPDITAIADDDPDIDKYLVEPDSELARLLPKYVSTTVAGAKRLLAQARGIGTLLDTVRDETLHDTERVAAAVKWRAGRPAGNDWENLSDADLVESLCLHPHAARLKELSKSICDPVVPTKVDWRDYVKGQWAAIQEFNQLRGEYPLRQAGAAVIGLEYVAARVIKNSPPEIKDDHSARQAIYDYARDLEAGVKG